jgi:general stress protein CsbA
VATGRPHLLLGGAMSRFLLCLIFLLIPHSAFSFGAVACGGPNGEIQCFATANYSYEADAAREASAACLKHLGAECRSLVPFHNECAAVALFSDRSPVLTSSTRLGAQHAAEAGCYPLNGESCRIALIACDSANDPLARINQLVTTEDPTWTIRGLLRGLFAFFDLGAVGTGISFGLGIILALLIYAARGPIINFVIHGNLPYKLPVYGEDIQCLIKRTQRVNWYGRVVFGIVVNLAMTHQQLNDVRKYWLGRVIAFDSLRRQRQNELARMHLQLAASVKSDPHDKKKFWSRRWATFRTFIRRLFWIFTAFFSFLLGFLFIRITIAKLVQGTIIESADLVLILQAKDAIEESTTYLKEYLTTADTFDGRDEIYEPQ